MTTTKKKSPAKSSPAKSSKKKLVLKGDALNDAKAGVVNTAPYTVTDNPRSCLNSIVSAPTAFRTPIKGG